MFAQKRVDTWIDPYRATRTMRRSQDPIADLVPALHFADDLLAAELIGILVRDGFVHVGIKRIAGIGRNAA